MVAEAPSECAFFRGSRILGMHAHVRYLTGERPKRHLDVTPGPDVRGEARF